MSTMPFTKGNQLRVGKTFSIQTLQKMSEARKNYIFINGAPKGGFKNGHKLGVGKRYLLGRKASDETKLKMSLAKKGKKMSPNARMNMSLAHRGEKSSTWKGGVTPINKILRESIEYRLWREAVFERDNWTCVWCKKRGGELNADHIKPFAHYPKLRFAIDNGRTLCVSCHKTTDTWGGRANKYA